MSRHNALVQLGMVNSPEEVPSFARELSVYFARLVPKLFRLIVVRNPYIRSARQPIEAQREIIAELDKWTRMQEVDTD